MVLFVQLQNEIQDFFLSFELSTLGSERVKENQLRKSCSRNIKFVIDVLNVDNRHSLHSFLINCIVIHRSVLVLHFRCFLYFGFA